MDNGPVASYQSRRRRQPLKSYRALALVVSVALLATSQYVSATQSSALSEDPVPLLSESQLPTRTPPLLELGPSFLGTGNIDAGIELPTGAVWQPALWVFGNLRSGINLYEAQEQTNLEWVTTADLFFNLRLSGTERVLLGFQPLDSDGEFTLRRFRPGSEEGWESALNLDIQTLFFEGEIGEIFPNLDPTDQGIFDVGFAVGRQPLEFQDGMMLNDSVDSVAVTWDTIVGERLVDTRITALYGWGDIHLSDNRHHRDAALAGLYIESDLRESTVSLDATLVTGPSAGEGDGLYLGVGAVQRVGLINTTFRVNSSIALEGESDVVSDGTLFFTELSLTPAYTDDVAYLNAFHTLDHYTAAARAPGTGGPLGRTGLLFAGADFGGYPAALNNRSDRAFGGVLGYQFLFDGPSRQLVLEVGGRSRTDTSVGAAVAVGARYQQALSERALLEVQGFSAARKQTDDNFGLRAEIRVQF